MKKILVIEDTDEARENLVEILTHARYQVISAENGKKGFALAEKERPDLIICDILMPVLDGFGVLHLLQKKSNLSTIPFIFLTAKTERSDLRKGMELGADDFITKPFDVVELLKAIQIRLDKTDKLKSANGNGDENVTYFSEAHARLGLASFISDDRDRQKVKKKRAIYLQGNRPVNLHYVVKGKVKAFTVNESGKELINAIYKAGDFFGYSALLNDTLYTDNTMALEDSELIIIPKDEFLSVLGHSPMLSKEIIDLLAQNLSERETKLLNMAYCSLRKKVADGLLQIVSTYKETTASNPRLKMRREDLAQAIGVAKESLTRTLSDFKTEKLIDIVNGEISVLKEAKLKKMAN